MQPDAEADRSRSNPLWPRCFYNLSVRSLTAGAEKRGWQRLAGLCLLHWHLCSLDAPLIAVVWAIALQRLAGARVHAAEMLVLALGTWIVYVLDRVLDGAGYGQVGPGPVRVEELLREPLRERHYFHLRHRRILLRLCCGAAAVLAMLCLRVPQRLVAFYLLLGIPVSLYGLLVHRRLLGPGRAGASRVSRGKEAAVAALFTAAVAGPALIGAQPAGLPALLPACLLLALLCWINCALINYAEAAAPTRRRRERLIGLAVALAFASATACGWALGSGSDARALPAAAAVLLSCLLLLLLLGVRHTPALRVRILADLALLTPLLFLIPHS